MFWKKKWDGLVERKLREKNKCITPTLHVSEKEKMLKAGDSNWSLDEFKDHVVLLEQGKGGLVVGGIDASGATMVKRAFKNDFVAVPEVLPNALLRFTPQDALDLANGLNNELKEDASYRSKLPKDVKWRWQDIGFYEQDWEQGMRSRY